MIKEKKIEKKKTEKNRKTEFTLTKEVINECLKLI